MLEVYKDKQPLFYDEITHSIQNKKISHAYLIETNDYSEKDDLILSFAKMLLCEKHLFSSQNCGKCNICHLIDKNALSDFIIIEPDGMWIKKEQILEMKEKFKTTSLQNNPRVYWIKQADKLNKQSANSLLKFLEEPEGNIIAILEVANRYQVLETIRSRCQVYSLVNQQIQRKFSDFELLVKIIQVLEEKENMAIAYLPITLENDYHNKDFWNTIFTEMIDIYESAIRKMQNVVYTDYGDILHLIVSKNRISQVILKLQVLFSTIQNLNYNLNMNMMLDQFIIEFSGGGCHE